MEKSRIVIIVTPSGITNIIYDNFKKYFKNIEIVKVDLDNKINGTKPSLIYMDDMSYNDTINTLGKSKVCGDCKDFGELSYGQMCDLKGKRFGCTTSFLEEKHGNKNTPACSEFKKREDDATLKVADTN